MILTNDAGDSLEPVMQLIENEGDEGSTVVQRNSPSHLIAMLSAKPEKQKALLKWLDEQASANVPEENPGAIIMQDHGDLQAKADEFKLVSEFMRKLVELDIRQQSSAKR